LLEASVALGAALAFAAFILLWDSVGMMAVGPVAYANDGGCDVWEYFGLALRPKAGPILAPDVRLIGRVMYFAPIYALGSVLPGIGASLINYFLFFSLALTALYLALRAVFSRRVSVFVSLVVGASPLLVNSMSSTYSPVAAYAYECCMLACVLWAARAPDRWRYPTWALAGLFFAWQANAHIQSIEFSWLFCLFTFLGRLGTPLHLVSFVRHVLTSAAWFLGGMIVGIGSTIVVAAAIGTGALSPFFQIRDSFDPATRQWYPDWTHHSVALGLIVVLAVLAVSAAGHGRGEGARHRRDLLLVISVPLLICAANLFSVFVLIDQSLVYDCFYVALLPSLALVIGAAFERFLDSRTEREARWVFVVTIVVILVVNGIQAHVDALAAWEFSHLQTVFHGAIVLLLGALAVGRLTRFRSASVSLIALVLVVQSAKGDIFHNTYFASHRVEKAKAISAEMVLRHVLASIEDRPLVWVSLDRERGERGELGIVRGLLRCDGGSSPASIPGQWPARVDPQLAAGRTIIAMGEDLAPLRRELARLGFGLEVMHSQSFDLGENGILDVRIGKARSL
jgi:hypothetical protein